MDASAEALLPCVPVAKRCIRLLRRKASIEGRDRRGQAMEETMPWSITELMHLTRDELCGLAGHIEHALTSLETGTVGRLNALASLDNIRRVMVLRGLHY